MDPAASIPADFRSAHDATSGWQDLAPPCHHLRSGWCARQPHYGARRRLCRETTCGPSATRFRALSPLAARPPSDPRPDHALKPRAGPRAQWWQP
eukprot:4954087-Prymnesium_polylepis.1